jgi:ectoine hydroxylase-related dioxygenase (phytanoyl-CoA dioxygenase family)
VITEAQVEAYHRDGFIVVENLMTSADASAMRQVIAECVDGAAAVETRTAVYDLEPGHTPAAPKVRRIKMPHKVHKAFDDLVRSAPVIAVLQRLIGRDLRLHGSKLNMKAACYGSPVEWHQDWAFYPHTNDDLLAIGVMLDDMDLENGPLLAGCALHRADLGHHGLCRCAAPRPITTTSAPTRTRRCRP